MAEVKKRPSSLPNVTYHVETGCGEIAVTVTLLDEVPFEVFVKLGKQGGCSASQMEAMARAISIGLRSGVSLLEYAEHFENIQCNSKTYSDGEQIMSCADAISKVFKKVIAKDYPCVPIL